jgi:anti-sigma regulatory factor (Ser/Thr protein kinase)
MEAGRLHLVARAAREREEHRLPVAPRSVGVTRDLARSMGERLGFDADRLGALELVISEVVTNAVRHGGGREVLFAMTPKPDLLCVQVTDGGAGFVPVPRAMGSEEGGGFGLFLVERLTRRWGMTREHGRTRVWFELDLP